MSEFAYCSYWQFSKSVCEVRFKIISYCSQFIVIDQVTCNMSGFNGASDHVDNEILLFVETSPEVIFLSI